MKIVGKRLQTHLPLELQLMAQNSTTSVVVSTPHAMRLHGLPGLADGRVNSYVLSNRTSLPCDASLPFYHVTSVYHVIWVYHMSSVYHTYDASLPSIASLPYDASLPCDVILPCDAGIPYVVKQNQSTI